MMKVLIIFFSLLALQNALGATIRNGRIIGGEMAEQGQFKYMASIQKFKDHVCGGSIISEKHILTAAHCYLNTLAGLSVLIGTTKLDEGGVYHELKSFTIHSDWNPDTLENDIAIIELETPIVFNDLIQPISLPTKDTNPKTSALVSGWGVTPWPGGYPNDLMWLTLVTAEQPTCRRMHLPNPFADSQLCTLMEEGYGVCSGDSGSPLVHDGNIIGITSAAYICGSGMPDIFTRVYSFLDWIEENSQ